MLNSCLVAVAILVIGCNNQQRLLSKEDSVVTVTEESPKQTENVFFRGSNLIVNYDDHELVFKDLFKEAGALFTTLNVVDRNFFLTYEYSASSTKMTTHYSFTYNNETKKVFLVSKEIIKLFRDKTGSNKHYFSAFEFTTKMTFSDLEGIQEEKDPTYNLAEENAVSTLFLDEQKFGTLTYSTKGIDRFMSPFEESQNPDPKNGTFSNIELAEKAAQSMLAQNDYADAIFLFTSIRQQSPEHAPSYLGLGDALWKDGQMEKAKEAYNDYISKMKSLGKEDEIPEYIIERIK